MEWWAILLIVLAALLGYLIYSIGIYAYFVKRLRDKNRR